MAVEGNGGNHGSHGLTRQWRVPVRRVDLNSAFHLLSAGPKMPSMAKRKAQKSEPDAIGLFEQLYAQYVERFGVEPEWNLAPLEQQLADLQEALRRNRPIPPDDLPEDAVI